MNRKINIVYFIFGFIWINMFPFLNISVGIIKILPNYIAGTYASSGIKINGISLMTELIIWLFLLFEVTLIFCIILTKIFERKDNINIKNQITNAFLFGIVGAICSLILSHVLSRFKVKGHYLFINYPLLLNRFNFVDIKNCSLFILYGMMTLMIIIIYSYYIINIKSNKKVIYYGIICAVTISIILKIWFISDWIIENNTINVIIRYSIFIIVCSSIIVLFSIVNRTKEFILFYACVGVFLFVIEIICGNLKLLENIFYGLFKNSESMLLMNSLLIVNKKIYIYYIISYVIGGAVSLVITNKPWKKLFGTSKNNITSNR